MKILVTGAAGFIGQHLTKHLTNLGHSVLGLDIVAMEQPGTMVDITNDDAMGALVGNYDALVHLAAVASPPIAQRQPALAWTTNVQGTQNVLQLALKANCRKIIFFSSAHVYGISPKYMPTDENHPLALHDTYTTTKIIGEQLCRLYYENHGLSYTTLRLWNAYGPGQSPEYFIGKKIAQAKRGELTIRNEGVTKDWVHVTDVCRAVELSLKSDYVGPLNVGTGKETSLRQIVDAIGKRFNVAVVKEDVPDEGPTSMCCDWKRILLMLGWTPTIPFERGLAQLMEQA